MLRKRVWGSDFWVVSVELSQANSPGPPLLSRSMPPLFPVGSRGPGVSKAGAQVEFNRQESWRVSSSPKICIVDPGSCLPTLPRLVSTSTTGGWGWNSSHGSIAHLGLGERDGETQGWNSGWRSIYKFYLSFLSLTSLLKINEMAIRQDSQRKTKGIM